MSFTSTLKMVAFEFAAAAMGVVGMSNIAKGQSQPANTIHGEVFYDTGASTSSGATGMWQLDFDSNIWQNNLNGALGLEDSACRRFYGTTRVTLDTKDGSAAILLADGTYGSHDERTCIPNPQAGQPNQSAMIPNTPVASHDTSGPFDGDPQAKITFVQGGQAVGETVRVNDGWSLTAAQNFMNRIEGAPAGDSSKDGFVSVLFVDKYRDGWAKSNSGATSVNGNQPTQVPAQSATTSQAFATPWKQPSRKDRQVRSDFKSPANIRRNNFA